MRVIRPISSANSDDVLMCARADVLVRVLSVYPCRRERDEGGC